MSAARAWRRDKSWRLLVGGGEIEPGFGYMRMGWGWLVMGMGMEMDEDEMVDVERSRWWVQAIEARGCSLEWSLERLVESLSGDAEGMD